MNFFRLREMKNHCDKLSEGCEITSKQFMAVAKQLADFGIFDRHIKTKLTEIADLWSNESFKINEEK